MNGNFKDSLKSTINNESDEVIKNTNEILKKDTFDKVNVIKFSITKKKEIKDIRKSFNVYMSKDLVEKLDSISTKTSRSRNEIINEMCDFCADNIEIIK